MSTEADYEKLLDDARGDDDVLGVILTGSRGRGFRVRPDSDFDVRLIVRDEALDACRERYGTPHGSPVEVAVLGRARFEQAGLPGSGSEWDRYSYVRAQVALDQLDGEIAARVTEKATLSAEEAHRVAAYALDGYVNSYYRSARNHQNGLALEAHLDAAESIAPLLTTLFALDGRVRPFNKFLAWELELDPLEGEVWVAGRLLARLQRITGSGDLADQQSLFRDVETLARARSLGHVIDGWEPDVAWLRGSVS